MADTVIIKVDVRDGDALAKLQNLDKIADALNNKPIQIKVSGASSGNIQQLSQGLSGVNNTAKSLSSSVNGINQVTSSVGRLAESAQKLQKTTKTIPLTGENAHKVAREVKTYSDALGNTTKITSELNAETGELARTFETLTTKTTKTSAAAKRHLRENLKEFRAEQAAIIKTRRERASAMPKEQATFWTKENLRWRTENRSGTFAGQWERAEKEKYQEQMDFSRKLQEQMKGEVAAEKEQAKVAKAAAKEQAKLAKQNEKRPLLGDSLPNIIAKMAAWQLLGTAISKVIGSFREAFSTMKEVDSELTNIQKVTNMSGKEIAKLGDAAYSTASKYGVAANEYLESVTVFAKAGYKDMSEDLGELAIKTQLVGDVSAEMASKFLLSVDAAYKMNGSIADLSVVLDEANEIENNYATSIEKIAEGMPIVASVANTAHMSIEETMAAIGTITATTQESGTMAARALRALILNIMGDTQTEIEEGVSWTEGEIETLNDVLWKYSETAMEAAQASGEVVNPMEAIAGLSKAFQEGVLTEAQLVEITTDLGGKLRTNQLLALIKNFDTFESMMERMGGAAGSADKEVGVMLSSWDAKTKILKNSWTEFISNLVETDAVKGGLDAVIGLVDGLNSLFETGADRAEKYAESIKKAYEEDYGEGSRYEYLIEHQKELNELEREELIILEARKKAREEETAAAEKEKWAEWQKGYMGNRGAAPNSFTGETPISDIDMLNKMQYAIKNAALSFENTRNLAEYKDNLSGIVAEYADYVQKIKDAKEAGQEISEEQENQAAAFDVLTKALADGLEGYDSYGIAAVSLFMAMGYTASEAQKLAIDAVKALDDIPPETESKINVDSDDAQNKINGIDAALSNIDGKVAKASIIVSSSGGVYGGSTSKFASGTRNAPGGPALVNDGSGPEIISANGTAFIAGGGRPTIVDLPRGASVLTAEESRPLLSSFSRPIRAHKDGSGLASNAISTIRNIFNATDKIQSDNKGFTWTTDADGNYVRDPRHPSGAGTHHRSGSGTYGGYGGSGGSGGYSGPDFDALEKSLDDTLKNLDAQAELAENEGRFLDAMKIYGRAQDEIGALLDKYRAEGYAPDSDEVLNLANKGYDYANKEFGERDTLRKALVDALNGLKDSVDDANTLEEKKQAVEDAREALANAETQRTVRIYNPVTDQWEWVANPKDIKDAQERLKNAEKSLSDHQIQKDIEALENSRWEDIGSLKPGGALAGLINGATEEQKQAIANALGILSGGVDYSGTAEGKSQFNQGSDSHDTIYDFGDIKLSESEAGSMTVKELADRLSTLKMGGGI